MKNLLVTGGCGFIGGNLITRLNKSGRWRITVLDNESVGRQSDLDGLDVDTFIQGDVRDQNAVERAVTGQDAVIHLAAQTGVMPSLEDPAHDCAVNIGGGLNLLQAAVRHKVGRFINASSSAPVGVTPPPMHEDLPARPAAPYGASKLAMEGYCSAFYHSFGLPTASLRFANCYGPGSRNKSSVVALFMRNILAGQPLTVYGDGMQTRDFVYVDDLCAAMELALESESAEAFGRVYQAATGVETSLKRLIAMIGELVRPNGLSFEIAYAPARPGEILRNYSDITRIRETFGFAPAIELSDGLARTWSYFKTNSEAAA